jgi:hypothetical protein
MALRRSTGFPGISDRSLGEPPMSDRSYPRKPWLHAPSGMWCVQISGKRHYLDRDPVLAQRKLKKLLQEQRRRDGGCREWLDAPFSDLADEFLDVVKACQKPATYRTYQMMLQLALGHLGSAIHVGGMRRIHLTKLKQVLTGSYSPTTVLKALHAVQRVFNWAVANDLLDVNPSPSSRNPSREKGPVSSPPRSSVPCCVARALHSAAFCSRSVSVVAGRVNCADLYGTSGKATLIAAVSICVSESHAWHLCGYRSAEVDPQARQPPPSGSRCATSWPGPRLRSNNRSPWTRAHSARRRKSSARPGGRVAEPRRAADHGSGRHPRLLEPLPTGTGPTPCAWLRDTIIGAESGLTIFFPAGLRDKHANISCCFFRVGAKCARHARNMFRLGMSASRRAWFGQHGNENGQKQKQKASYL